MDIEIRAKGINDISAIGNYIIEISLQQCDLDFINDISAEDIVSNCNCTKELLEQIDDSEIFAYLEESGIIFNKG